ncbi:Basic leucine zipper transcriptional factor ATF-like 2 [Manis javanica]|nr:Basic leucine zipper transcriptional factor ATF-like 2 [Manis javanica]
MRRLWTGTTAPELWEAPPRRCLGVGLQPFLLAHGQVRHSMRKRTEGPGDRLEAMHLCGDSGLLTGTDPEEHQKQLKKKQKNRVAAQRSRQKHTDKADALHQQHESLEKHNHALQNEIQALRAELSLFIQTRLMTRLTLGLNLDTQLWKLRGKARCPGGEMLVMHRICPALWGSTTVEPLSGKEGSEGPEGRQ